MGDGANISFVATMKVGGSMLVGSHDNEDEEPQNHDLCGSKNKALTLINESVIDDHPQ